MTAGGRVLGIVGQGDDVATARHRAYQNLERVHFAGMWSRSDIALLPGRSPTMSVARVGIVMGSESDLPVMRKCGEALDEYGIAWEIGVMSAHRAPDVVRAYARQAERRGLQVLVAGAGCGGPPPRGAGVDDPAPGDRRPPRRDPALRLGRPAQHRPDASRGAGRHRRHRRDGRAQRRPPGGPDPRPRSIPRSPPRVTARRHQMGTRVRLPEGFEIANGGADKA